MKRSIIVFIGTLLLSGCMLGRDVIVSSFVKPPPAEIRRNYYLLPDPSMQEGTERSLLFLELKAQVLKVLASRGFVEIDPSSFDYTGLQLSDYPVCILLSYGVHTFKKPGGFTISGQSQSFGAFENFTGEIIPYENTTIASVIALKTIDYAEEIRTGGKIVLDDEGYYGMKGGDHTLAWSITAVMFNSSGDIQIDFPFLLAAIRPYIAMSTGKRIEVRLTPDDKSVIEIKEILNKR
jgi:hypothetical protein